jgi:galactokinase
VYISTHRIQKNEVSVYVARMTGRRGACTALVVKPETIDQFQELGVNGSLM